MIFEMKPFWKKFTDFSVPASRIAFRHVWCDYLAAACAGFAFFVLAFVWAYPAIHPDVWNEIAVAAGTRPPECVPGGVWRGFVACLFDIVGIDAGLVWLRLLGKVAGGGTVACVFVLMRCILPRYLEIQLRSYIRRRWLICGLIAFGAFLFGCSDPVWRAFQQFGPEAFVVSFGFISLVLFYRFLLGGGRWGIMLSYLLAGVLAAESPAGFVLVAFLTVSFIRAQQLELDDGHLIFNPFAVQRLKWQLTFMFLIGLVAALAYDFHFFVQSDGFVATGLETPAFVARFFTTWWKGAVGAATPLGWAFGILLAFVPCLVSFGLARRATNTEKFLPYELGGFFVVSGIVTLVQLAGWKWGWFWTWVKFPPMLASGVLGAALMYFCALAAVFALAVIGVDFWCRDYRHVAVRIYSDPNLERNENDDRTKNAMRVLRFGLAFVVVFVLGGTVWGRHKVTTRRMVGLIDEFVTETVRECAGAHWLFTDGVFDPMIEVRSRAMKRPVVPLSLMASKGAYDAYLRVRSARDKEDRSVFETSVLAAFQLWAASKPERMKETAFQLGFERWRQRGWAPPLCLGVVATGAAVPKEEVQRAVDVAHALSSRILAGYIEAGEGHKLDCPDGEVMRVYECVQWRLARLAQQRALAHGRAGEVQIAAAERNLAEKLDARNVSFNEIQKKVESLQRQSNPVLTPREGLEVALRRNDFVMARRYALPVLNADPDNVYANYAMGMSNFLEERWDLAARFLERTLVKRPNDPVVMNNIAVSRWKNGRLADALFWCEMALKVKPDVVDVKENLERIRKDYDAYKKKLDEQKQRNAAAHQ